MSDPLRWPAPLRPGDTVAAVAPAGPPDRRGVEEGLALLRGWGLEVRLGASVFAGDRSGFLAAPDDARAADLQAAFADSAVTGVLCLRGGYGCQRLLERLDFAAIAATPKPFVGFSDVTALHVALRQRAGLVTFHGPSLQWDAGRLGAVGASSLQAALTGDHDQQLRGEPLVSGQARAALTGGNLSVLSTLCGTPDQLRTEGAVLLLEDVAERPYRLDRMLVQLRRAGMLDGVAALAFDGFHGCVETGTGSRSASASEVAAVHAGALGVPAVFGLPVGHGPRQRTVPLGATVTVDGTAGVVHVEPR